MHEKRNEDTKQKQVFDWACKMLMNMSHASIVHFINGLFQKDYPADSSIAFLSTEHIRTGGEQAVFGFPACDRRGQIPYRILAEKR